MADQRNLRAEHFEETPCAADIGFTEEELESEELGIRALFSEMSAAGPGFDCYGPTEKRFGRSETVQAIKHIAQMWHKKYPDGPRIGVGNLSYQGGGPMHPHKSHQKGVDVDLAPIASTDEEIPLTWQSPKYSRDRTQQLVDLIRNNPIAQVRVIFFNDPDVTGVEPWAGHDNHLHVSFFLPEAKAEPYSSDQTGSLRLVSPPMAGERVRKLQQSLAAVNIPVDVDGVFGAGTDAAVREFQAIYGLEVDGAAGEMTLAKIRQVRTEGDTPTSPVSPEPAPPAPESAQPNAASQLQTLIQQNRSVDFSDVNDSELVDNQSLCYEIQSVLQANQLLDAVDGLFGPKTREALRNFKAIYRLDGGDVLTPETAQALLTARPGSGQLPDWAGGDREAAIQAIKQEAQRQGISNPSHVAYILATVEHETAGSFQPVRESYYLGEEKGERHRRTLRYYPYYGRGYVQLTWDYNYRKYSTLTGLDLVNQPDLVMRPDVSLFVLVDGMKRGVFTGRSLDDYTQEEQLDFVEARRIINGKDRAGDIAAIANNWMSNLA